VKSESWALCGSDFEIVKREHTRELSNLVSATSVGVTAPSIGYVRQANVFWRNPEGWSF
jgi:hypothetical protein